MPTENLASLDRIISSWRHNFEVAYIEYGPHAADETGLAGQWADLHRKVRKLKPAMWEGDATHLRRESMEEILQDIMGHALLALEMLDRGITPGRLVSCSGLLPLPADSSSSSTESKD